MSFHETTLPRATQSRRDRAGPIRRAAWWKAALATVAGLALSGCTEVAVRAPAPEEALADLGRAHPYGLDVPGLRFWGDELSAKEISEIVGLARFRMEQARRDMDRGPAVYGTVWLTLSGGGPDGAYGAGLLAGWTQRGDRPDFGLVTGISTGAIVAVFAFLGPDYDDELKEVYTTYQTSDLAVRTVFSGLTGGAALLDTSGLRTLIETYIDDEVMAGIAERARQGRILLIGTTNLDATRPVIWNVSAIAASGHPDAKRLVHDIVQASSAIPAVFPPLLIPVEIDGVTYDEMHVDGGATQQVMLFSPKLPLARIQRELGFDIERTVYIIINNKLDKPYSPVAPRSLSIAGSAISSLISGSSIGDIYKIYTIAQRDGINLRVNWIPESFDVVSREAFDPAYMTALYEEGFATGLEGPVWLPQPPDYAPRVD